MIHIHIHVLMNCLECGALHNFWPSACSDRDGNQAFLSRILNTVDKLGWKLLFSHFFRSKWSRKSDSILWPSVVFDGFCMKWLWLAITILCMSVHVSILSWSKLDLAAAGQTWTSPFRSFVLQGTKRPPCGGKGKRDLPIWNRPLPNVPLFTIPWALLPLL